MVSFKFVVVGNSFNGVVDVENRYKILPPDGRYRATVEKSGIVHAVEVDIQNRRICSKEIADGAVVISL